MSVKLNEHGPRPAAGFLSRVDAERPTMTGEVFALGRAYIRFDQ
jgi:hypothetical protein